MPRIRYVAVEGPPRNPILKFIGFVAGLGLLAVSFVFGAFLLAALIGLGLIAGLVIYLRVWWLRRRMDRATQSEYLETEYRVVDRHKSEDRKS